MNESAAAIIDAAYLPLSIIIIGVGNADFGKMEYLDGDDGLIDNAGRRAKRDLVQFVPFNKYRTNPTKLAEEVLYELPTQLCEYMRMVGIKPDPPQVVDVNNMNFSMQSIQNISAPGNNPNPALANLGKNLANTGFMANILNQQMNPGPIGFNQPAPFGMNTNVPPMDNQMNPAPFGMGQQPVYGGSPQNYPNGGVGGGYQPGGYGGQPSMGMSGYQQQTGPHFGQGGQRPSGANAMFGQNYMPQQQNNGPYQVPGGNNVLPSTGKYYGN